MTRTRAAGIFQRMSRELAADQIGLNPALKAVLDTMRALTKNPRDKSAQERLEKINEALPLLEVGDPVSGSRRDLKFHVKTRTWLLIAPLAWRCLEAIVDCANTGDLDRFRQCAMCGRWFYARTRDQKCHNSSCRQKLYATSTRGKKERSKYMRKYRADTKERERRQTEAYRKALNQKPN